MTNTKEQDQILDQIRTRRNQQLPTQEINKSQGKLIILQSAEEYFEPDHYHSNPIENTDFQLMDRMFTLIKHNLQRDDEGLVDSRFEDLFWEIYDRFIVEPEDRQTALQQVINRRRS